MKLQVYLPSEDAWQEMLTASAESMSSAVMVAHSAISVVVLYTYMCVPLRVPDRNTIKRRLNVSSRINLQ